MATRWSNEYGSITWCRKVNISIHSIDSLRGTISMPRIQTNTSRLKKHDIGINWQQLQPEYQITAKDIEDYIWEQINK